MSKKPLLILVGPTAVGKTAISIDVAKAINAEIISADSMQIYKFMDIGTAKISKEEMKNIKHYMINEIYPDEEFSVSDFQKKAYENIDTILNKGKLPMVVGGTGLYINSLVYDLDFTRAVSNWSLRNEFLEKAEQFGNEYIHDNLKQVDPESAERIHINDTKRIIRALEVYYDTGTPMSKYYNSFRQYSGIFNLTMLGLNMDRKELYDRINIRVDDMISNGLINEVNNLLNMGYSENYVSMQGLGYKEIVKYLKGQYSLDEAVDILKRDSRRFAKRQLTWFRRDERIHWINIDDFDNKNSIVEYIINYVKERFEINNN
jgi:tRNA dimethylallyltransferase